MLREVEEALRAEGGRVTFYVGCQAGCRVPAEAGRAKGCAAASALRDQRVALVVVGRPVAVRHLGGLGPRSKSDAAAPPLREPYRCAHIEGFSLHADVDLAANDRQGLLRLVRYGARQSFSQQQLAALSDGRLRYAFKRPFGPHRVRELMLSPTELLHRLAALLPKPYREAARLPLQHRPQDTGACLPTGRLLLPSPHALRRNLRAQRQPSPGGRADHRTAPPQATLRAAGPAARAAAGAGERRARSRRRRAAHRRENPVERAAAAHVPRRRHPLAGTHCAGAARCAMGRCITSIVSIVAFIDDPAVVRKILSHLRRPTELPTVRAIRTPAMQAGITDRLFSFRDVFGRVAVSRPGAVVLPLPIWQGLARSAQVEVQLAA